MADEKKRKRPLIPARVQDAVLLKVLANRAGDAAKRCAAELPPGEYEVTGCVHARISNAANRRQHWNLVYLLRSQVRVNPPRETTSALQAAKLLAAVEYALGPEVSEKLRKRLAADPKLWDRKCEDEAKFLGQFARRGDGKSPYLLYDGELEPETT